MDPMNRFHTSSTWRLVRLESLIALGGLCYLIAAFSSDVRWSRFMLAFVLVDLIGYVPGAIAYRLAAARAVRGPVRIAAIFHHLYNLCHSFVTVAAVLALWFVASGEVEWAMLALPIHLLGDRGLFGNTYKPASLPFDPAPVPSVPSAQSGHSPSLVPPRRAGSHAPAGAPISIAQPGVP